MADVFDVVIAELNASRGSILSQPLEAVVDDFVAMLRAIQAGTAGAFLPLAGGTMTPPGIINLPTSTPGGLPPLAFNTNYGVAFAAVGNSVAIQAAGAEAAFFGNNFSLMQHVGGGYTATIQGEGTVNLFTLRATNDVQASQQTFRKSRGTLAAPLAIANGDSFGQLLAGGYDGVSTYPVGVALRFNCIDPAPGPTAMGARILFLIAPVGSASAGTVMGLDVATGLTMFAGATPSIDANRLLRNRIFTVATLPTFVEGAQASVSDATLTMITGLGLAPVGAGANHVPVTADNVGWKIL